MPPQTPQPNPKRALPNKESGLFRELLHLYESRQLKKAIKTADTILKKFPEHGETLCMKGLVLTHLGRRDEGKDLVKRGIRLDLTSHIVWHVFGLIQKADKDYDGALKSYHQALRFEKDNQNILRDAAHLQTQLRLYDQLLDTRIILLRLRPNLRQNWIALAVAHHLAGDLQAACTVLEQYQRTLKNVPPHDVEHSELLLYHARILEDLGAHSQALDFLDEHARTGAIVDLVALAEARARLLSATGPPDVAEASWRTLLKQNADNVDYYRGLLRVRCLDLGKLSLSILAPTDPAALGLLVELSDEFPRATALRLLVLRAVPASSDRFTALARAHLLTGLHKGIPSLFASTKGLYTDTVKRDTIERLVEGFKDAEDRGEPLDGDVGKRDPDAPTTYLWTLYYLAQHYSALGAHQRALALVVTALQHTPTLPELHTLRGRILKRLGDLAGAADAVDAARRLDGQDRFLNTKSAKYWLRAGDVARAGDVLGLFTKKDAPSPGQDLEDMQSLLYLLESGAAEQRLGRLNLALKRYHAIERVFSDFEDDQYDFHGYSLRRSIINIYLSMIKWANSLRAYPAYVAAALAASEIYIRVHDDPALVKLGSAVSAAEEKKAKKKAKKAAAKAQDAIKQASSANANEDKGLEAQPAKDEDPDGTKLLTDPAPLDRAWRFLAPLRSLKPASEDARAAQALNRAKSLDPENPDLHPCLLHFRRTCTSPSLPPPHGLTSRNCPPLTQLLPSEEEASSEVLNARFLQLHARDARAILSAAKGARVIGAPVEEVEGIAMGALADGVEMDLKTARAILDFLRKLSAPRADEFRKACDTQFALSTLFKTPDELAAFRAEGVPIEDAELIA
ncbi:NMDA receptor-regulated protein 1-domain-containing protein [Vararia minispora EC-137]|uniref:NMDA receptor-regulated protein 1-domain-containing protein n=1 Tax=Vararia minispora EC-137 TaxID=1314806 RepID=A0ACB8QZ21_9AGAM|nr:NMDA receptor-regulated protein 1-domain-containing protein [Vararia minispora EC-137]